MDYDHPYRHRASQFTPYYRGLVVVGLLGGCWVVGEAVRFTTLRLHSSSVPAIIVGYERAGGRERLRVQTRQDGKPGAFFVVDAREGWPRYTPEQAVHLLTWVAINQYGQKVNEAAAYAAKNYWAKPAIIALVSLGAGTIGLLGLRQRPTPAEPCQ